MLHFKWGNVWYFKSKIISKIKFQDFSQNIWHCCSWIVENICWVDKLTIIYPLLFEFTSNNLLNVVSKALRTATVDNIAGQSWTLNCLLLLGSCLDLLWYLAVTKMSDLVSGKFFAKSATSCQTISTETIEISIFSKPTLESLSPRLLIWPKTVPLFLSCDTLEEF